MSKDIIWFAENIWGVKLTENQKEILCAVQNSKDKGEKVFLSYGRMQGIGLLKNTLYGFEIWLKDQRIAELEEQLKNAIVPPVKLGSMIYKLVYNANIDKYEIYNYSLDYCDDEKYYTSWESIRNSFRTHYFKDFNKLWFATKEEAQAKLKELGERE